MDLIKLKYLCKTAEVGSLRKAAEAFNVTPGALSKALKLLESEFNTKIFLHSALGSALTEDGSHIYEQSRKIIQDYETLKVSYCKKNRVELKLGTYCHFTSFVLEDMLATHLPLTTLSQLHLLPGELEKAILDKRVDLGITFAPFPQNGIDVIPIATVKMGIFGTKGAFVNKKFNEIPFVTCVMETEGSVYQVQNLDAWPCDTIQRNIKYKVFSLETALGIARRGLAVIYCPDYLINLHNKMISENFRLVSLPYEDMLQPQEFTISLLKRDLMPENHTFRKIALYFRTICRKPNGYIVPPLNNPDGYKNDPNAIPIG